MKPDGLADAQGAAGGPRSVNDKTADTGVVFGLANTSSLTPSLGSQATCLANDGPVAAPSAGLAWDDYEILGEIARGGMGIVYKARQKGPDRIVALKMIQAGRLADDEDVRRFRTEAEAAGSLEHPNIVPIYDVGEHQGHHFFSMGYVEGQNLRRLVRDGPLGNSEVARIVRSVAAAMDYAHARGVIHRDLKPENVLIDAAGQPHITDFGLAKRIDRDSQVTATGQILGTPSYMSPEQARGDAAQIGPASDVYSLGALMYCLLTGRPPFQAAQILDTLRQVVESEPASPRALNPAVDRDLETLCLKCLSKDPSRRVSSAQELADELGRYARGEPIRARPVGRLVRFGRWCLRNRLVAGLTGGLVVVLTLGAALSTYFAVLAERRAHNAEQGTQVAVRTLQNVIHVVQEKLKPFPEARAVRSELLRDSLRDLDQISTEFAARTTLDHSAAVALVDLGRLFEELGSTGEESATPAAVRNYEKAIGIYRLLIRQEPRNPAYAWELTVALEHLGNVSRANERWEDSLRCFGESLDIRRKLAAADPSDQTARADLLWSLANAGDAQWNGFRKPEARQLLDEAVALGRELVAADPKAEASRRQLGFALETLGDICLDSGDLAAARSAYEESHVIHRRLYDSDRRNPRYLLLYSTACERMGDVLEQSGDPAAARVQFEKMWTLSEESAAADPTNSTLQDDLAVACDRVGEIAIRQQDWPAARRACERAVEIRTALVAHDRDNARLQRWLAESQEKLRMINDQLRTMTPSGR